MNGDIEFLRSLFLHEPGTHNQTQPQTREQAANRVEVAKRSLINEVEKKSSSLVESIENNDDDSLDNTTTVGNNQHTSRIYN